MLLIVIAVLTFADLVQLFVFYQLQLI